ncbi:MAG TPA: redox-sensing transcriptional repressor Rex [Mycobacteriales bacterium]
MTVDENGSRVVSAAPFPPDGEPVPRERPRVPEATVARLPLYLRALNTLTETGAVVVSSEELAVAAGVNSAQVRKDLSQLGSYGIRGVGYDVTHLIREISRELGLTRPRSVAIVGIGNLGHALAGYGGFAPRGVRIGALLDADPARIGETVGGLPVRSVDELEDAIREEQITIGVIATPVGAAQATCDRLVAAGVLSILNFAPTTLVVGDDVDVRKVDLSVELQILSFHERQRSARLPVRTEVTW